MVTQYESDIRPSKMRFYYAAMLFLIVAVACTGLARARRQQEKTLSELVRAKAGFDKLKEANVNRRQALATLKVQLGSSSEKNSPELLIYGKLDEIKARLKPDDVTVAAIERKGGEVTLPYTIKFSNQDYSTFLNAVSYLQESALPLTPVNAITISQTETTGKSGVLFTITGNVRTTEKSKP